MLRIVLAGGLAAALAPFGQMAHATSADAPAPTLRSLPPAVVLAQAHGAMADQGSATFAVGDLVVEGPWARESVTPTGAVYLTVRNDGDRDDRLIRVSSEVAGKAELHGSAMEGGVMRMHPVEALVVPAHGEAALAPGGLHVMLMGLKGRLEEGESFALTLEFEHAGTVEVMAVIEDIAHGGDHSH